MKLEKLFSKKLELKGSHVFGGNTTYRECTSTTAVAGSKCTDVNYSTYDDNNKLTQSCNEVTCP